ncbi:MAG: SMI1/KNR4 family protein [Deltaproteobacteria bacterium]|nr:SMI1/KNR4 family protein [Deltaproteobacteria bacterium]
MPDADVHVGAIDDAWETLTRDRTTWRRELAMLAAAEPVLRALLPFWSLNDLRFSRSTTWPYDQDLPLLRRLASGAVFALYPDSRAPVESPQCSPTLEREVAAVAYGITAIDARASRLPAAVDGRTWPAGTLPPHQACLLAEFRRNPPASDVAIALFEAASGVRLPDEYLRFMRGANGGEGAIGRAHAQLWTIEDLLQFNVACGANEFCPEVFVFGSDGGGEAYAFDRRTAPWSVVLVPFIFDLAAAVPLGATFDAFLETIYGRGAFDDHLST